MVAGWLDGSKAAAGPDPIEVASHLASDHVPVKIEMEKSHLRFTSVLAVHGHDAVLVGKPPGIPEEMVAGDHVRLTWEDRKGRHEMRLEITIPNINLANGSAAFVCKPPQRVAEPQRDHDRHDLSRFTNVRLRVDGATYRIVDLSDTGCRITADPGSAATLPVGKKFAKAELVIRDRARIPFESLVIRSRHGELIGCEFTVLRNSKSAKRLAEVLASVETSEARHPPAR